MATTRHHTVDDWLDALDAAGWKGWKSGREWKGPCPICDGHDRFHVAAGKKAAVVASCRGGCSFEELVRTVFGTAANAHHQRPAWRARVRGSPRHRDRSGPAIDPESLDPAGLAVDVLMELDLTPPWRQYLANRGLNPDRLAKFGWRSVRGAAGWKPLAHLPGTHGWPQKKNGGPCWPLGVDRGSALIIPFRDCFGMLAGLRIRGGRQWRELRKAEGREAPKCLGLAGVPAQLYGAEALQDRSHWGPTLQPGGILHIAEGEVDTESLREHGVVAIGVPGATIWKPEWTDWIRERQPRRIVIWFDGDEAGAVAGKTLRDLLSREFDIFRLKGVERQDVNDLARARVLPDLIRKSENA